MLTMSNGGGFFENESAGDGGAIIAVNSTITLNDITFQSNSAGRYGDAIALLNSDLDLSETIFIDGNRKKNKHVRSLKNNKDEDDRHRDDDRRRYDDDKYDDAYVQYDDDYVRRNIDRFPSEVSNFDGMGNLIFIGDDADPNGEGSFVDCDTDDPPLFCSGIDILEVGTTFNNTNCRVEDEDVSKACKNLKW